MSHHTPSHDPFLGENKGIGLGNQWLIQRGKQITGVAEPGVYALSCSTAKLCILLSYNFLQETVQVYVSGHVECIFKGMDRYCFSLFINGAETLFNMKTY